MSQKITSMNRESVAKTWVFRGLSDIFFAFDSDDVAFENQAKFSEIMGLEKFLKAVLLHQLHHEYEPLPLQAARHRLNKLALGLGHKFDLMLKALPEPCLQDIEKIKLSGYGGYIGRELVFALREGYMETRYPVPTSVSDNFPIGNTGYHHDPLGSSGLTEFVYALCNACFFELSRTIDFLDMLTQFEETFRHRAALGRFNNLFWEARCRKYPLTFA